MPTIELSQDEIDLIGEALEELSFQIRNPPDSEELDATQLEAKDALCSNLMVRLTKETTP